MSKPDWQTYCNIFYHLKNGFYGTSLSICDNLAKTGETCGQILLFKIIALIKLGKFIIYLFGKNLKLFSKPLSLS